MNILIAPDKFKGTLSASEVCNAIELGLSRSGKPMNIKKFPLADGGEGTLDVFLTHTMGSLIDITVHDPLMRKIKSAYALSSDGKTAFIEMARASGLGLLKADEMNPLLTTSYGTGELIADAFDRNVEKIVLGIGGSATNDGALGAAVALGLEIVEENGSILSPIGKNLSRIKKLDLRKLHKRLSETRVIAICDVTNPFYGMEGAAYVYAKQKGASVKDIAELDRGLVQLATVIQSQLGIDLQSLPGSGAGGGFAGGAHALLGAELKIGTEVVFEFSSFDDALNWADVVITGEGKMDQQTLHGKLIAGIAKRAVQANKKVIVVCGLSELNEKECNAMQIAAVHSLTNYAGKKAAIESAYEVLELLAQFEIPKRM